MTSAELVFSQVAARVRDCAAAAGGGVYLGAGVEGWAWAKPEHTVLVVGPPRSGKTSSIVVPAVAGARGAVISTSTKPEVMQAVSRCRSEIGDCYLFDPTGGMTAPPGVRLLAWSPVDGAAEWDRCLALARSMVGTLRPGTGSEAQRHWIERAESLLAPLLHAAALEGLPMEQVVRWVMRREPEDALSILAAKGTPAAGDLLYGITVTDQRELSGIWSTASGVLSPYRGSAALASSDTGSGSAPRSRFDPEAFAASRDTVFVCAPGRDQSLVAPIIVGLLEEARAAAYRAHAARRDDVARRAQPGASRVEGMPAPILFALDEVANIAPLPDLPALVSEGGGQGVVTLACLQDLSQARQRWGEAAAGFLTLFGTKVILPGVADLATLDAVSTLAGAAAVATRSLTVPQGVSALRQGSSVTWSLADRKVLTPDAVARGVPGSALILEGATDASWVRLTPYFSHEPWRTLTISERADSERQAQINPSLPLDVPSQQRRGERHRRDPVDLARIDPGR